jgi:hypothetical protein
MDRNPFERNVSSSPATSGDLVPSPSALVPKDGWLAFFWRKIKGFLGVCRLGLDRISVFGFAILAIIAFPCLPVFIEWYRTGEVKADTYYITAAVLAAAFAVTAEHIAFIGLYITSFVINLVLDMVHGPFSDRVDHWAGILLAAICGIHASERFWWHIFLDRPFPDR